MSQYQVDRINHLQKERSRLSAELETQTSAALIYAALAVVGWGAFVVVLIAC